VLRSFASPAVLPIGSGRTEVSDKADEGAGFASCFCFYTFFLTLTLILCRARLVAADMLHFSLSTLLLVVAGLSSSSVSAAPLERRDETKGILQTSVTSNLATFDASLERNIFDDWQWTFAGCYINLRTQYIGSWNGIDQSQCLNICAYNQKLVCGML
jgi:hypothetical protein